MPETNRDFDKWYALFIRFSFLGVMLGIALVVYVMFQVIGRLENLAPAEMRLLLDLLKNRFLR